MLKNIDFQIDADDKLQKENEAQLGPFFQKKFTRNIKALAQYDISLAQALQKHSPITYSPFVTKKKYLNVMNITRGRSLYEEVPQKQVKEQVRQFATGALLVECDSSYASIQPKPEVGCTLNTILSGVDKRYQPPSDDSNLVILGCGLGLHLFDLIRMKQWKRVVIIEPEIDLLHVSLLTAQWKELLDHVNSSGLILTILTGSKEIDSLEVLKTWKVDNQISSFYLYRHYNYSVFNTLEFNLATGISSFNKLNFESFVKLENERECEFSYSLFNYFVSDEDVYDIEKENMSFLYTQHENSLSSFKRYFPDIASGFDKYQADRWLLFSVGAGAYNLFDLKQGVTFFVGDPKKEALSYFEHYKKKPKIDALDARQSLHKPSPFIHYEKSRLLKDLVLELPDSGYTQLPQKLPSFIMYGGALGYQIESLLLDYEVDNFILYEPNPDFFFASMWVLDWTAMLRQCDDKKSKLYLNIGDDGTNMFDDIHLRLQSYGIHILSYTFFYVSYYQEQMDKSIRATREQFKVLLNISEYFDHAFYNLNHTNEAFSRNQHFLLKDKPKALVDKLSELPVFIIGNGPSLDSCSEYIKEHQDKAIIVSCGTSLKALYELGIKPDFHAEVEQTKATLHWVCQVPDPDWLKSIDLITVNGIHPDVTSMFGDTLFCLKKGEAGSLVHLELSEEVEQLDGILYSYPTVSNCALSYVLQVGFRQIYLFGVDLGFKDPTKHHSKHSAYFNSKDGKALYDYSSHGVGFRVPGNFDSYVFTKHEFKYSSEILSKALSGFDNVECYNTSDGAYISGTMPLRAENILLVNDRVDKNCLKKDLKNNAYKSAFHYLTKRFEKQFRFESFAQHCDELIDILTKEPASWDEILEQLNRQVTLVKESVLDNESLFYYLVRGSASFCLTYLTRLAYSSEDEAVCLERYAKGKSIWIDYLREMRVKVENDLGEFDQTPSPHPEVGFDSLPALEILKQRGITV
ncbi:motility associated factor glycosyltransferase family protein [Agarivorans litoreus]|uniref:motility associated factor glycosyltransferase family protein n=1 Tax=Agarivorans litoreus TaxID=1510455 RepID=UPI001C7E0405|nr:6-hydroxymethylpterin diphosphokinase MptE-like protein [Agarivorans litoreus]